MAPFPSPRKPALNVSQYVANLNAIPDVAAQQQQDSDYNIDDELAQFTNTEFFDFDAGALFNGENAAAAAALGYETAGSERVKREQLGQSVKGNGANGKGLDFLNSPSNSFPFQAPPTNPFELSPSLLPNFATTPPSLPYGPSTSLSTPDFTPAPYPGLKHPLPNSPTSSSPPTAGTNADLASTSILSAADEDKRRRNTAASARFRVKKKQREQALEKTAGEYKERILELEGRVRGLEQENELLKGLLVGGRWGGAGAEIKQVKARDMGREEEEEDERSGVEGESQKAVGGQARVNEGKGEVGVERKEAGGKKGVGT